MILLGVQSNNSYVLTAWQSMTTVRSYFLGPILSTNNCDALACPLFLFPKACVLVAKGCGAVYILYGSVKMRPRRGP
jgi:hypothetical protein